MSYQLKGGINKLEYETVGIDEETEINSISDVVDSIGIGFGTFIISIFSGFFFCLEAAELTMLSFILPHLKNEWNLNDFESSLIATSAFFGIFLGSFVWGWFSDRFGRKDTIVLCSCFTCIFGCLTAVSFNFFFFVFFEFLVGFCVGGAVVCFSFYIEFLPRNYRGITLNGVEIFWCLGVIVETGVCWIILTQVERFSWRFLTLVTVSPCLICIILAPWIPRSPRYLYIRGLESEVDSSLAWLERMNCRKRSKKRNPIIIINNNEDDEETEETEENCFKKQRKKSFSFLIDLCRVLFCSGFDSLFLYVSIVVFYSAGSFGYYGVALACPNFFPEDRKYLGSFIVSLSEIPGLLFSSLGLFLVGRKFTQTVTFLGCGLGLALLLFPGETLWEQVLFGLVTRGMVLAATCVTWVIANEAIPTNYRSLGCGVAAGIGKATTCFSPLIVSMFPQHNAFIPKILFGLCLTFAGVLCIFFPYESKGKELKDFAESKDEKAKKEELKFDMERSK